MATTALTMVNRVNSLLRKGGPSSVSSFSTDPGAVLLVCVNAAKNEVLELFDWDFDIRHDGELVTVARRSYTATFTATNGSTAVTNVGQQHAAEFVGSFRSRLVLTSDTTAGGTSFAIATATDSGADDAYVLESEFTGTGGAGLTGMVYVVDYQLPTTVKDVLSVRHEEDEVQLAFIDRPLTFDRIEPAPHEVQTDSPEIVYVGGSVESTTASGGTSTTAPGLMVWPVPTTAYLLSYSYRYRHPQLSATTDELDAPHPIIDLVVDKALAKAYRSAIANDPEMADRIDVDCARRLALLQKVSSPAPMRRTSLKSHDRIGGPSQFGSRPANPRIFYTP